MFKNYLKTTFRSFFKHKSYSLINIIGLSVGMACCLLIMLFVQHEFSYDKFHSKADNIYRIVSEVHFSNEDHWSVVSAPVAYTAEEQIPEIEEAVILKRASTRTIIRAGSKSLYEANMYFSEPELLNIFDLNLIDGNNQNPITSPNTVILSEKAVKKYFGNSTAVGKVINIDVNGEKIDFTVTGIYKDLPSNSHIELDVIASYESIKNKRFAWYQNWMNTSSTAYALLTDNADVEVVNDKLAEMVKTASGRENIWYKPYLQPITDIRLNTAGLGIGGQVDVRYVYMFSFIALLILVIAGINYMNLATARATKRSKEVGIRKVMGAPPSLVMLQFITEAILFSSLSMLIAIFTAELGLPFFNELTGAALEINFLSNSLLIPAILTTIIITGFISGAYPAFILSRFEPTSIFKDTGSRLLKGKALRKLLVIGQFTATFILIVCTLAIFNQLNFIQSKNLGYNKEHVIQIPLITSEQQESALLLKESFKEIPQILSAAASSNTPTSGIGKNGVIPRHEEDLARMALDAEDYSSMSALAADYSYHETLELKVSKGRWFSPEFGTDENSGFVVNEAAVKHFGWDNPIGQKLQRNNQKGSVIGVVKDFHFTSLHKPIEPIVIFLDNEFYSFVSVRVQGDQISKALTSLQQEWQHILPGDPFEYQFLDESYAALYQTETRASRLFITFSVLAIIIACLGILGLLTFTIELKQKELSIRKVLGASISNIIQLLSSGILKLVLPGLLIGAPIAWYISTQWLNDFSYRTNLSIGTFLAGALATLAITTIIVLYQSSKAASVNPIDNLKNE